MLVYVTAFVAVVLLVVWWYWWDYYVAGSKIPGPPAWPLIGNVLSIPSDAEKLFTFGCDLQKQYGSLVRIWAGPKLGILMTDANDVQALLAHPKIINRDYSMAVPFIKIMGRGIIVNRDDEWKSHRKLLNQIFHFKILMGYIELFGKSSERLLERMEEFSDGKSFDPLDLLGMASMESIRDAVFGTSVVWPDQDTFMDLFKRASNLMMKWTIKPWLMIGWVSNLTEDGIFFYRMRKKLFDTTSMLLQQKLHEFEKADKNEVEKKTRPFADVLIEESAKEGSLLSLKELQEEMNTLVITSIDTSSNTVASFLTVMGIYPDIQQELIHELKGIFGDDARRPTSDDINEMHFLERCLKETLRLLTVAPFINREVGEDVELPSGYRIPRGASVIVSSYAVHRDPGNFPEPERFWPDRWLPENSIDRHPCAFVPFGYGKRNCIGQKYALLQMKTVISGVFRHYSITTTDTWESINKLQAGPIVSPVGGYHIQLHKLKK